MFIFKTCNIKTGVFCQKHTPTRAFFCTSNACLILILFSFRNTSHQILSSPPTRFNQIIKKQLPCLREDINMCFLRQIMITAIVTFEVSHTVYAELNGKF